MATPPTEAQISQVGQAQGGASLLKFGHTPGRHTTKHSRSFIHYVNNAMDATGLDGSTGKIDEGWQYLPYRSLRASMNPRVLRNKMQGARAFKVKSLGVKVQHFNPIVERIAKRGDSTVLDTVFENKPFLMKLVDHELSLDNVLETPNGDKLWNVANTNMTRALPESQTNGTLPRVIFNLGQEFVDSLSTPGVYSEEVDAWGSFNTLSGFDVTTHQAGEDFGHTWAPSGGDTRWYPTCNYTGKNVEDALPDPASSDYDLGAIEYNVKTQINQNFLAKPPPVLVKINPVHGPEGPINIAGYTFVTYTSEVEWSDINPSLLTQNINAEYFDGTARSAWEMTKAPNTYNLLYPNGMSSWQQTFVYETPEPATAAGGKVRAHPNHLPGPQGHPYAPPNTARQGVWDPNVNRPFEGSHPQAPSAFGTPHVISQYQP